MFEHFRDVYLEETNGGEYTITMRQFYYAMRPLFLSIATQRGYEYKASATPESPKPLELNYGTFQQYVDQFETEELGKRVIHRDDRGFFVEPHSDQTVDLETATVERYSPDSDQFGNLLFVEKTGFYELLHREFELTKRYDLGLINSQGYSTIAGRRLVEKVQEANDATLYLLTDLDINGLGIAKDATKADALSPASHFDGRRLGVTLADVERYDLPAEPVGYDESQLTELRNRHQRGEVSDDLVSFLTQDGGQRVEINAFSPVELKDYLTRKFEAVGIEKVEPAPEDVETPAVPDPQAVREDAIRDALGQHVWEEALRAGVDEALEERVPAPETDAAGAELKAWDEESQRAAIHAQILDALDDKPPTWWREIMEEARSAVETEVDADREAYADSVSDRVREYLEENVTVSIEIDG